MVRDKLRILVYLISEVLIILGIFFIVSLTLRNQALNIGLILSLLAPFLLILTRVMIFRKKDVAQVTTGESDRKTDVEALYEHLEQIGLNTNVVLKQELEGFSAKAFAVYGVFFFLLAIGFLFGFIIIFESVINPAMDQINLWFVVLFSGGGFISGVLLLVFFDPTQMKSSIIGVVRVANQNIDLVELEKVNISVLKKEIPFSEYESIFEDVDRYRCNYVVQAKVEGLEDKLKAHSKPATAKKGLLTREVIDIVWKGGELAQVLNSDAILRDTLFHMKDGIFFFLEIKPDRKHQCVKIKPQGGYASPADAFPTIENFEAFNKIAQHIYNIAKLTNSP